MNQVARVEICFYSMVLMAYVFDIGRTAKAEDRIGWPACGVSPSRSDAFSDVQHFGPKENRFYSPVFEILMLVLASFMGARL